MTRAEMGEWEAAVADVESKLEHARRAIDHLSDLAVVSVQYSAIDEKACYAANSLHGAEALVREADALFTGRQTRFTRGG